MGYDVSRIQHREDLVRIRDRTADVHHQRHVQHAGGKARVAEILGIVAAEMLSEANLQTVGMRAGFFSSL